MTLLPPEQDDRLMLKKPECFSCLHASWKHSPGHHWYPRFSHCRLGNRCEVTEMSPSVRIFITGIYLKYHKQGRIRDASQ